MKITTLIATLVLAIAPNIAAAACGSHSARMSCAEGQTYDSDSQTCVPTTS